MRVLTKFKNPRVSRKELRYAAKFIYACLVPRKMFLETILVVESLPMRADLHGQTYVMRTDNYRYPKRFRIQINNRLSRKKQLCALAHELVHVKQFALDELGHSEIRKGQTFTKWKSRMVNETRREYENFPWEVEAFRREMTLYQRYVDHALI